MPPHVIRSLDDFLQVPEAQLPNCLAALHRAIEAQKKLRESAQVRGLATRFTEFEWRPKEPRKPVALKVTATTAVQDLGLKPAAVFHFREMNLYALEDFAEVTAIDLRRVPDVGDSTVAQVRELLAVVGLRFREPTDPYYARLQRAKLARGMSALERKKDISDAADIADLGLKSTTLTRCIGKGIMTVGQLRTTTLRDLCIAFGRQSVIDLLECLDGVGLELESRPTQTEKWRWHAIRREALKRPQERAPIEDLQPWIGAGVAQDLTRAGLTTVGALAQLARAGGLRVRGVGQGAWDKIFDYFGLPRRTVARTWRQHASTPQPGRARLG